MKVMEASDLPVPAGPRMSVLNLVSMPLPRS